MTSRVRVSSPVSKAPGTAWTPSSDARYVWYWPSRRWEAWNPAWAPLPKAHREEAAAVVHHDRLAVLVHQRGGRGAAPPPQRAEGAAVQGAARRRAPARGHDRADVGADALADDGHERADGGADLGADVADGGADGRADGQADVGAVAVSYTHLTLPTILLV